MYHSNLRKGLARKYAIKHFLAWTEKGKEALWLLGIIAFGGAYMAYLIAHMLIFIYN